MQGLELYASGLQELFQIVSGHHAPPAADTELLFVDLPVNVFHELHDEFDDLALDHVLHVRVRHKERDVVPLHGHTPQHLERLRPLRQEPHELPTQNLLKLIRLFHPDVDARAVDGTLDETPLVFVARDEHGIQDQLRAILELDLRLVVALHHLARKVLDAQREVQRLAHLVVIWLLRSGHGVLRCERNTHKMDAQLCVCCNV
mmetsp:Transcript_28364/g.69874  ORF Transcript_28364/g.69874 Transcript_28364/m.69874 type:complete len:203 (+) Transcript_28364:273-881(+)